MKQYRLLVQVLTWYRLELPANSPEDAVMRAEAMKPQRIQSRGTLDRIETGLVDPDSIEPHDP